MITPDWKVSSHVKGFSTTRYEGFSKSCYASMNLGLHVGDEPTLVKQNRATLPYHESIVWLKQVHGNHCQVLDEKSLMNSTITADSAYTREPNIACCVMTADCLPILLCDSDGREVAAVHAGWRGLATGVIESTITQFDAPRSDINAWLGPAISARHFEVGEDVFSVFSSFKHAFFPHGNNKWMMNIYRVATDILIHNGIHRITGGDRCTFAESTHFFSYRRTRGNGDLQTGRMASYIVIDR